MTHSSEIVPTRSRPELLRLYLQDHLAAAGAGVALAQRVAANHQQTPSGAALATLAHDIEQDRDSLVALMDRLDVRPDRVKGLAALGAERVGRLKLNGSLLRRSPLSSLVELEGLLLGVRGKAALWRTLRRVCDDDPRLPAPTLDTLLTRADEQAERIEALRVRAVVEAFGLDG